jgi:pentatricopeptide repeat protein
LTLAKSGNSKEILYILNSTAFKTHDPTLFKPIITMSRKYASLSETTSLFQRLLNLNFKPEPDVTVPFLNDIAKSGHVGLIKMCYSAMHLSVLNNVFSDLYIKAYLQFNLDHAITTIISGKDLNFRLTTSTRTWNMVLHHICKNKTFKDAISFFEQMKLNGLKPDRITFTTLLSACTTRTQLQSIRSLASQYWDSAIQKCENGTGDINMYEDSTWCLQLIHSYSRIKEPEEAEWIAKHYATQGLEITVEIINTVLSAWMKVGEYERGVEWYNWMINKGYTPDVYTFSILINGVAHSNLDKKRIKDTARMWFGQIKKPNAVAYNAMIPFLDDMSGIRFMIDEMTIRNVQLTERTFLLAIDFCNSKRDLKTAEKWLIKWRQSPLYKTASLQTLNLIWSSYLSAYTSLNDLSLFLKKLRTLKEDSRFTITNDISAQIVTALINCKRSSDAFKYIRYSRDVPRYLLPFVNSEISHEISWNILLSSYINIKELSNVRILANTIPQHVISSVFLASLMKCCSHFGLDQEALYLWEYVTRKGPVDNSDRSINNSADSMSFKLPPIPKNIIGPCESMTSLYLDHLGYSKQKERLNTTWNEINSPSFTPARGYGRPDILPGRWPSENVYNSYIEALLNTEQYEEAVNVFVGMNGMVKPSVKTLRTVTGPLKEKGFDSLSAKVYGYYNSIRKR